MAGPGKVSPHINTNLGTATSAAGAAMTYYAIKTLIAAGWRVMEETDGTAYVSYRAQGNPDTVILTHIGSGAGGMLNANARAVLQDPGGVREVMLGTGSAGSGRVGTFATSALDKFVGGTPSASVRPTATDQQMHIDNSNLWSNRVVNHYFQGCAYNTPVNGVYSFYIWQSEGDDDGPGGYLSMAALEGPIADEDPDPVVYGWGDNNGFSSSEIGGQGGSGRGYHGWFKMNDGAETFQKMAGFYQWLAATGQFIPGYGTHALGPNPYNAKDGAVSILFGREDDLTGGGPKGRAAHLFWSVSSRAWPDTFTVNGERWAFINGTSGGAFLAPYPNGVTPTHDTASTDRSGEFYDAQASEAVDPVVTLVSPPEGRINRHDALTVDVTDLSGFARVVVMAMFPSTSGPWEVAHDGLTFGPGYTGSERTAIANGFRYTLRRQGGWFADPTLRVIAIDAKGNVEGA